MVMASRLDAVQSRLKTASTMKTMTKDIGRVTDRLKSSMASMNLEKIEKVMSDFEKTFTDLDVRTATVEGSMNTVMATSAPENEIQSLIKQVTYYFTFRWFSKLNCICVCSSLLNHSTGFLSLP